MSETKTKTDPASEAEDPMQRLLGAASDALTDGMVERTTATMSNALEVVDRLNDPDTSDAVHTLLDGLTDLQRNGGLAAVLDLGHFVNAIRSASTDSIVERGATTAGDILGLADHLSQPDTRDAIHELLEELTTLHRTGGFVSLFELVHFLNAMRNATTDNIVERGAIFVEHMVNNLATEEIATLASNATDAMHEAVEETAAIQHKGGLFATMSMLTKPETQASLYFLLTFAKKLQERA
jgi:uncharacterized protein YjgD (DUF1641 family)